MNNAGITKVYLLNVPLESDLKHTLYFTDKASQQTYFQSTVVKTYTDFTYQRKDQIIRIPDIYDNICECNYVMYQNSGYSNKWFYAFIDKMEYISDGRTDVHIKTDVIQTYLFDYIVKPSFVEREHVDDDTLGAHTIPEGLETGEYKVLSHLSDTENNNITAVMSCTCDPDTYADWSGGIYTGIPSGVSYYRYDTIGSATDTQATTLLGAINHLNDGGKIDALQSLFIAPKWLAGGTSSSTIPIYPSNSPESKDLGISRISALDGYTPRNKKLLTFPYCYIEISNNMGQATTYMQERWNLNNNNEMVLRMSGCLTPGCSIRCYPLNYNGDGAGFDDGITLGKFPSLNWVNDHYTNWLTQNGLSLGCIKLNAEEAGYLKGAANLGLGAASLLSGNVYGIANLGAGVGDILGTMQEAYRHSLIPNTAEGNLNSGDVTTALGANRFHCYRKSIKKEFAKCIDQFFDMYGYKVNAVKVPNVNHRANWWYTKTMNVNITGSIPNEDMDQIRACYNNGITFWKDPTKIYDYSQSNGIVS